MEWVWRSYPEDDTARTFVNSSAIKKGVDE